MATGAARLIEENYIQSGLVRYEYYYVAFGRPAGLAAAQAAECANFQGSFWPYHDILYANQTGRDDQFSESRLLAFADALNLDQDEFRSCLRGDQSLEIVKEDGDLAHQNGVSATPTLFINGEKIEGVQQYEVYKEIIDRKLTEVQS